MCKEEIAEQPQLKPRLTAGLGGETTTKRKRAATPPKEGLEFTGKFCGGHGERGPAPMREVTAPRSRVTLKTEGPGSVSVSE